MATKEDDIATVCNAVLDNYEVDGRDARDYCLFCGSSRYDKEGKIIHQLRCAVLIAKDLLTP